MGSRLPTIAVPCVGSGCSPTVSFVGPVETSVDKQRWKRRRIRFDQQPESSATKTVPVLMTLSPAKSAALEVKGETAKGLYQIPSWSPSPRRIPGPGYWWYSGRPNSEGTRFRAIAGARTMSKTVGPSSRKMAAVSSAVRRTCRPCAESVAEVISHLCSSALLWGTSWPIS
jgi:hypothetical protein